MSKIKTGQITFRMIHGRIIPILSKGQNPIIKSQKRAASRLIKSGKALKPKGFIKKRMGRRFKLLKSWGKDWEKKEFKLTKKGKILLPRVQESSGTAGMYRFMEKTGAVRVSGYEKRSREGGIAFIDHVRALTGSQRSAIKRFVGNRSVASGGGNDYLDVFSFLSRRGSFEYKNIAKKVSSKRLGKIEAKLGKKYGFTDDAEAIGYIMPSGKGLNFSGYNMGSGSFSRTLDHREISGMFKAPRESANKLKGFLKEAQNERKTYTTLQFGKKAKNRKR